MGGCASRPKAMDDLPVQAPSTTEQDQYFETSAQEEVNNDGGDQNQNEAPLVDLSGPEPEMADKVSAEDEVEAPANNADEVEAAPTEEGDKNDAPFVTL